ncbi:dCTP deaminase [Sphingopyxis sp. KK2]|uniref:dCTP deaminase n=1 Tax=Sphingopyxis sp. KK2 TaxID=1855727 RepID=UPI00097E56CF|nr:dCTP deaminase [Sphingopyxis sp. KK2]
MSALSSEAIRQRLNAEDLSKRLIVSPLLDEASQAKPGQAAIDVRLGFDFGLVSPSRHGSIDEFGSGDTPLSLSTLYRKEFVPFGKNIVIHPHQFLLAQTLEYLRLPSDLMAYVVGRSTWGRLGLIVATAVGIHPGFAGSLTLELRNLGETPLTLYPGQTVAQLFFHRVENSKGEPSSEAAEHAQYTGTVDMVPRRLSDPLTATKLRKLISD